MRRNASNNRPRVRTMERTPAISPPREVALISSVNSYGIW
jgi:hypothetical protein